MKFVFAGSFGSWQQTTQASNKQTNYIMQVAEKTHWKKMFNYDYLGAYSLIDNQELVLTIKNVELKKVTSQGGRKEDCLVCEWVEDQKPMILNKTNCKAIEQVYDTPYLADWIGKQVQIYIQSGVKFGNETTDALRIRTKVPSNQVKLTQIQQRVVNKIKSSKDKAEIDVVFEHLDDVTKPIYDAQLKTFKKTA